MNELKFSVQINAPKEKVWATLWQDETLRDWAGIIDPGTYMVGELKVGNEVQFLSGSGYGVTTLVEAVTPNEYLMFRHQADTQDAGAHERDKQWTGGRESYTLTEQDGATTLVAALDVPPELEEIFNTSYPKALDRVKQLAEAAG